MPAFSFKERFVPMIKDGSKKQTVRANRKNNPRPGQLAHLFYGMRTKFCTRLLPAQKIINVMTVIITSPVEKKDGFDYGHIILLSTGMLNADDLLEVERIDTKFTHPLRAYRLTNEQRDRFAWNDGFRPEGSTLEKPTGSYELMYRYWQLNNELPFVGTVTYWQ